MKTLACGVAALGLAAGMPALAQSATTYSADLQELNDSGVTGKVNLRLLKGDMLQVTINATGLEEGELHVGHVHGTFDDNGDPSDAMCPTLAVDDPANGGDGDGFIELAEGATTYGPIIIALAGGGDLDPDGDGTIEYEATFDLSDSATYFGDGEVGDAIPLAFREIVIHGLTVPVGAGAGTDGEVNGSGGYQAFLPVACGSIEAKGNGNRQGPKTVKF